MNKINFYLPALLVALLGIVSCSSNNDTTSNSPGTGVNNPTSPPAARNLILNGTNDGVNATDIIFVPAITGQYSLLLTTANSTSCNYQVTKVGTSTKLINYSPRSCKIHERLTVLPFIAGEEYTFNFKAQNATSFRANFLVNSEGTSATNNINNTYQLSAGVYNTVVGTLVPLNRTISYYRLNLPTNATISISGFPCGSGDTLWLELYDFGQYRGANTNFVAQSNTDGACVQSLPVEAHRDYLVVVANRSQSRTFFEPGVQGVNFKILITL